METKAEAKPWVPTTDGAPVGAEWWASSVTLAAVLTYLVDQGELEGTIGGAVRFLRAPWVYTAQFQDMRDHQLAIAAVRS